MSNMINYSLRGNKNGYHWESLVGYTLADLIRRLNKTMPQGYVWKDFLSGRLHIDHIIPISAFNFTKPEHTDFKRCWALSNLRLLPAKENLSKHNHLDKPFQPALRI
jgi:5-methylcytosine-specific restriction endonuclease McrA